MEQIENPKDGDGITLHNGDRVYCLDIGGEKVVERFYGELYYDENSDTKHKWFVKYDDGDDCVVLDFKHLWKA